MDKEKFTIVSGKAATGKSIFSVLLKRTYDIQFGKTATRVEKQPDFLNTDVYYDHGDPEWSTVKYENEIAPFKQETDVVLIAKAYAPSAVPVHQVSVGVDVAGKKKIIRVIGDRYCHYRKEKSPVFSEPKPFTEMQIRYENAYGGIDQKSISGLMFSYPRNPLGKGLALQNIPEVIQNLPLPNLEDPENLLEPESLVLGEPENWNKQPLPQGLGWMQRTWYPRCSFVGAVPGFVDPDEKMQEEVLGLVPECQIALARQFKLPNFDTRFNNGASVGLRFPYLAGTEQIKVANLTPNGGVKEFQLPGERPGMMLDIGMGASELDVVLHTVCIRLEDMQVDMIWRGALEYPGTEWLPQMKRLHAEIV